MIFLDSNIIIELLNDDGSKLQVGPAVAETISDRRAQSETLFCDLVVVAEVAAGLSRPAALAANLDAMSITVVDLDTAAALRAAEAYCEYRRRGGERSTILPDFLIAAHAATLGASLMTRDRRLGSYFPGLTLITPETHP